MIEHSREPWLTTHVVIPGVDVVTISTTPFADWDVDMNIANVPNTDIGQANARRIVAGINACEGITIEGLAELTNLGGLKYLDQTVAAQGEKLRELMIHRNEQQTLRPGSFWDGKGLPPVGAGCEVNHDTDGCMPATVVAHHQGFAVVVTDGGDLGAGIYQWDECRQIHAQVQATVAEPVASISEPIFCRPAVSFI